MRYTFERKISLSLNDAGYGMHIRKGQFIDKAHLARHEYFAEIGWASIQHEGVSCSTEVVQDSIRYASLAKILDTLTLSLSLEALAEDRTSCTLRWDFAHDDGQAVVSISSTLVWLRSDSGQAVAAPPELAECLARLPAVPN